ncbi:hypothetical protein [Dokdonella sp.]|uniref:hypothetical protein n=1 Tax=Dokdonella sp. TaxID=2291710 RepID=UPI0025B92D57|nr:hypothetical protein [Dokdonella sp.]MBX3690265.1 hypothetical protein [Dokdonella sp.]
MIKTVILAAGFLAAMAPLLSWAQVNGASFDVLASVMETHSKEINAHDVLDSNKKQAEQYREKVITGWWEFMQASSKAGPGEYCAASFLRAKRLTEPGKADTVKEGIVVTLFGPGGNYRGALLAFSPLGEDSAAAFPKLASGKPVLVTLKQGNIKPATLNAIYLETGPKSPPLLAFAVPSMDALLAGMEDKWNFDVIYQGKSIARIEWHDGLKARDELAKCLAGKPIAGERHRKGEIGR